MTHRYSNWLLLIAITLGIVVLCILGGWQVKRLYWKESLIEEVETRIASAPVNLIELESRWKETGDVRYLPVRIQGTFIHDQTSYYFTTYKGISGWDVLTPLKLADNRILLVNRGFVPDELLRDQDWQPPAPNDAVDFTALARNPILKKPNWLVPDNDIRNRKFFWKDFQALAKITGAKKNVLPFTVDIASNGAPGTYPVAGTTRISFPNNHLQYAITWFGLAGALAVVGGIFFFTRLRSSQEKNKHAA